MTSRQNVFVVQAKQHSGKPKKNTGQPKKHSGQPLKRTTVSLKALRLASKKNTGQLEYHSGQPVYDQLSIMVLKVTRYILKKFCWPISVAQWCLYDRQPFKVLNRLNDRQCRRLKMFYEVKQRKKNVVIGVPKRNRTRDAKDTRY